MCVCVCDEPDGARDLSTIFSNTSNWNALTRLDLSVNDFFSEGAKILTPTIENSISSLESLTHLNLAWNWFEPVGFEIMKNSFRRFKGLKYLNLCGNKFEDQHKKYLRDQYEKRICGSADEKRRGSLIGEDEAGELIL